MELKGFVNLQLLFIFILFIHSGRTQYPSRYYQYSSSLRHLQRCPYPGYYPDPSNCNRFYRCVDYGTEDSSLFLKHDFNCAPGTVFDPILSVCNFPDQVQVGRTGWCQYQVQAELDKLKTPDYYSWDYEYQRQLDLQRQRQRQLGPRQPLRPRPRGRQQKRTRYQDEDEEEDYATVSSSTSRKVYVNSEEIPPNQIEIQTRRKSGTIVNNNNNNGNRRIGQGSSTEEPDMTQTKTSAAYVYQRRPFYHYQVQIPYLK